MIPVVGVFKSREDATAGVLELHKIGISEERITTLTPQVTKEELHSVPTTQGEQPGMFTALSATVGGALGAGVVEALAATLIPGVGPVIAIGLAGGAVLGAITGGAIGYATETAAFGPLPEEELFVYEDALRKGRTVVIAMAESSLQRRTAAGALERAGAESVDRARKMWWLGLRDVEKEKYTGGGANFEQDERYFRSGFETAMRPANRGKSYEEVREQLRALHPGVFDRDPFRRGYDRGREYRKDLAEEKRRGAPW